jgi:hypothetical protein
MSKSYEILGREGKNNPVKSEAVRAFREGYRKMLHDLGVREKKAVVFKEGKVEDLAKFLHGEIQKLDRGIERCVAVMDLAAVLYLWEAWVRGKECGNLERRQVHEASGIVLPGWSKTVQKEPSSRIEVETSSEHLTFLGAVSLLVEESAAIGQPVGSGFLFRPLTRDRKTFRRGNHFCGAPSADPKGSEASRSLRRRDFTQLPAFCRSARCRRAWIYCTESDGERKVEKLLSLPGLRRRSCWVFAARIEFRYFGTCRTYFSGRSPVTSGQ